MDDEATGTPQAPGWDADPYGRHELRYWDGAAWTDHVSDAGVAGHDEPDRMSPWAAMAAATASPPEPAATPTPAPTPTPGPDPAPAAARAPVTAPAPAARVSEVAPAAPAPVAPAPAATPEPSPPARPPGPSWAWDAPVTLSPTGVIAPAGPATTPTAPPSAPTPAPAPSPAPPAPAWSRPGSAPVPPVPPPVPPLAPPPGAALPGAPAPKRSRRPLWFALAVVCLAVIVAGGFLIFRSPDRIDAGPPAPTPAGFRVLHTDDYRLAVPSTWTSRVITSEDRERLGAQLDRAAPGAKDAFDQAEENVEGTMVLVAAPGSRENVNVVPFHAMRGDPSDVDTISDIRGEVEGESIGAAITGMTTAPADVHGFPAATLSYGVRLGSVTAYQVATVIQTGDHVFQVTVTAMSPERAAELSRQIVPTFDPA